MRRSRTSGQGRRAPPEEAIIPTLIIHCRCIRSEMLMIELLPYAKRGRRLCRQAGTFCRLLRAYGFCTQPISGVNCERGSGGGW